MKKNFLSESKFRMRQTEVGALVMRAGVPQTRASQIAEKLIGLHDLAFSNLTIHYVEHERAASEDEPAIGATCFVSFGPERLFRAQRDHERGQFNNNDIQRVVPEVIEAHMQLCVMSLTSRTVNMFVLDILRTRNINITETLMTSSGPMSTLLLHISLPPMKAFELQRDLAPGGRLIAQVDHPSWGVRVLTRIAVDPPTPVALKESLTLTFVAQGSYPGVLYDAIATLPERVRARVVNANDLPEVSDDEDRPFRAILVLSAESKAQLKEAEQHLKDWAESRGLRMSVSMNS